MDNSLKEKVQRLPDAPGIYLMRGKKGEVLYVGKAKSLKSRVRSYFTQGGDGRYFIPFLDRVLHDLEIIVVHNEKEALLLENNLIKEHRPKYNVLLRDDKEYPSLRLSTAHPFPRLEVCRKIRKDGGKYFGPYHDSGSIRKTLHFVNRHFSLRTCSDRAMRNRSRPCLQHQMGRCPAPCMGKASEEQYRERVRDLVLFLEGHLPKLVKGLKDRMALASGDLRFEEAARLRDQIAALERSLGGQDVVFANLTDLDAVGFAREGDQVALTVLRVRGGRVVGNFSAFFEDQAFPDPEVVSSFVNAYYDGRGDIPSQVLIPLQLEDFDAKQRWLSEVSGKKVSVVWGRRAFRRRVLEMAGLNAAEVLRDKLEERARGRDALRRIARRLDLATAPHSMECTDISCHQGGEAVASVVRFEAGKPAGQGYRHYRCVAVLGHDGLPIPDDPAMIYEVVLRRVKRGLVEGDLPDLLVIDGGKGQLTAAMAALKAAGEVDLKVVSLAKGRYLGDGSQLGSDSSEAAVMAVSEGVTAGRELLSQVDGGVYRMSVRSPERVFLPGVKDPVVLPAGSPEARLMGHLRDEAHRFAITYHRKRKSKSTIGSFLDQVQGIGPSRRKALLTHFGSVPAMIEAGQEQLAAVEGIGPALAEVLWQALHPRGQK